MTIVALLNGLWQGVLIVAVAGSITALLPKRHASTRYAVWFVSLLALVTVPFVSQWHPDPSITIPLEYTAAVPTIVAAKAASASGMWLVLLWLAGTSFFLLRLGLSYVRIHRIVRNATPAPELGPDVMTSDDVATPIAAGLFSPVVIVPTNLIDVLERDDLASILQHERAHIQRADVFGNLVQRLVEACLFFNPWVYVIGRQLIKEREAACDDWAVSASGEPHRYATCLVQLAQDAKRPFPALLTPSAIGPRSMLVGRIARLLNGKAMQLKPNYLILAASVAAFGLLAVLLQTASGLAASGPSSLGTTVAGNEARETPCDHHVAVQTPVAPDIAASDYHTNAVVNALVDVGADGKPLSVKIVTSSGYAPIDQATMKAAMSSTYAPEMIHCKPVNGSYLFHVKTSP